MTTARWALVWMAITGGFTAAMFYVGLTEQHAKWTMFAVGACGGVSLVAFLVASFLFAVETCCAPGSE